MKEFESEPEKIEIQVEQQQKKEHKFLGSHKLTPGHIMFEYDTTTGEINPAEYVKQTHTVRLTSLSKNPKNLEFHKRINTKKGCVYFQALNKNNAIKKLIKANLYK